MNLQMRIKHGRKNTKEAVKNREVKRDREIFYRLNLAGKPNTTWILAF